MRVIFARFKSDDNGATAIEYGLIAALIAVAVISGMTSIGNSAVVQLTTIAEHIATANDKIPDEGGE